MTPPDITILIGDTIEQMRTLADASVHCCVTSPPYWGLRDYGVDGQIGLEATPELFVARMVEVFREVRRVLHPSGTCWVNLGDSYATSGGDDAKGSSDGATGRGDRPAERRRAGIKPKDLVGIPWLVAFALRTDGWWLRQDVIWCLSGGTWLYVRTDDGGICLMTVKDLRRLKPETVRLWNGKEWTRLLGMSKSKRRGDELEITLRSGERIACTPTHRFPLIGGYPVKAASELKPGDRLERCRLPEPQHHLDTPEIGEDAAWLCGLYLAEGSRAGDTIQIAGHAKEQHRWDRLRWIAHKYGGTATQTIRGNKMDVRLYGKILNGIIDQFVSGRTAHDKGFAPPVWRCSNGFIRAMVDGYLAGDGARDDKNDRWRLGFCRNYNLERDLRTACARLGYRLTLNMTTATCRGKKFPAFRGELRTNSREHHNSKDPNEIVSIGRARCRDVYDLGVADEPHLFALASGILTHNSKPNPMPESVTDRCTKSHEYLFMLTKSQRYYFDAEAIKEAAAEGTDLGLLRGKHAGGDTSDSVAWHAKSIADRQAAGVDSRIGNLSGTRNRRSVWTITPQPFKEAHFATYPEDLVEPCIKAGTSERGCCPKCLAPWERVVERVDTGKRYSTGKSAEKNAAGLVTGFSGYDNGQSSPAFKTLGWQPTCKCDAGEPVPCCVLDPFLGSGTTLLVARKLGRSGIGCELNPTYAAMAERRIGAYAPLFGVTAQ